MVSCFTLSSSRPSTFTHPPPSRRPPHSRHCSLAFPYHPFPHRFNLQPPLTSSNVIPQAKWGSEFSKTEAHVVNSNLKEEKWTYQGLVTESLPNGMFRVRLDNEDMIIGYVSGKIRSKVIRITPGDKVKVEISRYDSTRGRIVYRIDREKDLGPNKGKDKGKNVKRSNRISV